MKSSRLWLCGLIAKFLPETRCFGFKCALLRWCGATIGKNVRINSSAVFSGIGSLTIGDDVWIGPGCYVSFDGESEVRIGSHVDIAPRVMIVTGSHEIDAEGEHIGGKGYCASVVIGDGCWLCAGAVILPGVALAAKTLVAAGAVVTQSSDTEQVLLAGVPARMKKKL